VRGGQRALAAFCASVLCTGLFARIGSGQIPKSDEVSDEEYRVYSAVLNDVAFPKENPHALIFGDTLNFRCGEDSGNPILVNGCSGMIVPPDTPAKIGELLRQKWSNLAEPTWADFEKKNMESARLRDSIVTSWKHMVVGQDIRGDDAKEWESPDCTFYVSRVGFDPQKAEAIVFVFLASYMDNVPSSGNYFLLRLNKAKAWRPDGRVQYFVRDREPN
jgi:hypothetical protein